MMLQGILLVYDVTNLASFDNVDEWLHIINNVFASTKKPHLALVGNKGLSRLYIVHSSQTTNITASPNVCWNWPAAGTVGMRKFGLVDQ